MENPSIWPFMLLQNRGAMFNLEERRLTTSFPALRNRMHIISPGNRILESSRAPGIPLSLLRKVGEAFALPGERNYQTSRRMILRWTSCFGPLLLKFPYFIKLSSIQRKSVTLHQSLDGIES
jgi:hypothetical protein